VTQDITKPTVLASLVLYAGFWRRLTATAIDFFILISLLIPVYLIINGLPLTILDITDHWAFNLLWFVCLILFWVAFGATPGKRLLNCKIVKINKDNTLSDIHWGRACLRALAYIISAVPIQLGFIWIAIDKNKRGFHDLILSTVVIIDEENYEDINLETLMEPFPK